MTHSARPVPSLEVPPRDGPPRDGPPRDGPPRDGPPLRPRRFPPPPPLVTPTPGLWRRTPPAIFPPILGLFGLGLGWRTLAAQTGQPSLDLSPLAPVGEAILGAVLLLYAFALVAWLAKPLRRPGVILEEIAVLPGRAGLAAMIMSLILAGAALRPYAPSATLWLACVGLVTLAAFGALILYDLRCAPPEKRVVTPVYHLSFVGHIVAPLALVPLGFTQISTVILWACATAAAVIWLLSLRQLAASLPPAPLRPLLAIHLAPASLLTTVSALLGLHAAAVVFSSIAMFILAALLVSSRWLLAAGFSPMWGALTFPLAACATACLLVFGALGVWIGGALLMIATALIPWVAVRIITAWAKGQLGAKTNAATV